MPRYVVEHEYEEPLTETLFNAGNERAAPCLAQYGVTWRSSLLAADRMRMICEFDADTAEQVRDALRSADVPFVRVWQALKYGS
jgi:hypothetical protein